jgi:hypothetical protein
LPLETPVNRQESLIYRLQQSASHVIHGFREFATKIFIPGKIFCGLYLLRNISFLQHNGVTYGSHPCSTPNKIPAKGGRAYFTFVDRPIPDIN